MQIIVCALYQFTVLPHALLSGWRDELLCIMQAQQVRGTVLLAEEGVNGSLAGADLAVHSVLAWLRQRLGLANLQVHRTYTDTNPFQRTKVKIKSEIVTMGVRGIDPRSAAERVAPHHWNQLISAPDTLLVDVRNHYEIAIGAFRNARNPYTRNFREFPHFAKQLQPFRHRNIALYCTGGIRCEKASAYLKQQRFSRVFQLQGGILNYLAHTTAPGVSRWQGECFVFDERVSLNQRLHKGAYAQCYVCRRPLSADEQVSRHYQQGVSCAYCRAGSQHNKSEGLGTPA